MENFMQSDVATPERAMPGRLVRPRRAQRPGAVRQELGAGEPIDIYHWAAVALVTALMCAVLGYAAGTPALARAANVTSLVFGAMGGSLLASGLVRSLRARIATGERFAVQRVPVAETQ